MTDDEESRPRLSALLRRVPELVAQLIRDEIASAKLELSTKVKAAVAGIVLAAVGAVLALYGLGWLLAAAVAGLAHVVPSWLAALLVGVALLIVAAVLALVGVRRLKQGAPPLPTDTVDSVREDVRALKGTGR